MNEETTVVTQDAASAAREEIRTLRQKVRKGLPQETTDTLIDALALCVLPFGEASSAVNAPEPTKAERELTIDEHKLLDGLRILDEAQEVSAHGQRLVVAFAEVDRDYLYKADWVEAVLDNVPGQYERLSTSDFTDVDSICVNHVARKGNAVVVASASGGGYCDDEYDATVEIILALAEDDEQASRLAMEQSDKDATTIANELRQKMQAFAPGAPRASLHKILRTMMDEIESGDGAAGK